MNKTQLMLSKVLNSLIVSLCISLTMTWINMGFYDRFLVYWLKGWGIAFSVAVPLSFFVPNVANRIVLGLFQKKK